MNEKKELSMSERISWALGQATGRQFITALVSTYILIFMMYLEYRPQQQVSL